MLLHEIFECILKTCQTVVIRLSRSGLTVSKLWTAEQNPNFEAVRSPKTAKTMLCMSLNCIVTREQEESLSNLQPYRTLQSRTKIRKVKVGDILPKILDASRPSQRSICD